ncbi:MAG: hypothetical protein NUV46_00635 [Nanoarchaeota archaeon]|nr:hypothetical protein [Nanoarchaeota archaeon]
MGIVKPSNSVAFADEKIMNAWKEVEKTDSEFSKHLLRAKEDILKNAFCGEQIPKKLIPKEYRKKYEIDNLWKYNLPNAWRLLYSVTTPSKVEIISVVLDWMDHTNYNRLFKY